MNEIIYNWKLSLDSTLENLKSKNLYRNLKEPQYIDFSSNDYLSLNSNGTINSIVKEIVKNQKVTGSMGSRLIRGHYESFEKVERFFAEFVNAQSSLLFNSGYAANIGVLSSLLSPKDIIYCDRLSHASLLDGVRLSGAQKHYFKHNDLNDLEEKLKKNTSKKQKWIITESVFSMDGDQPNLQEVVSLAKAYNCLVYLDEAHSIGINGSVGNGLACELNLEDEIAVRLFPCGKAPGFMGAFVAGNFTLKKFLINKARSFVYSTAQPPFMADILYKIILHLQSPEATKARNHLLKQSLSIRSSLQNLGYNTLNSSTQIIPVIFHDQKKCLEFQEFATKRNIDVRAIRPPTVPHNSSRIRLCIQSSHSQKDVDLLIDTFQDFI